MRRRGVLAGLLLATALVGGCAKKPDEAAKDLYFKATDLVKEKKIEDAIVVFQQVRDTYPDTEWGQKAKKDLVFYEDVVEIDQWAEQRAIKNDFRDISRACETYRARKNEYPQTLAELMPEYLKKVVKDPWGRNYQYMIDRQGGRQTIILACFGNDEIPGGEADAMDIILVGDRFTAGAAIGETVPGGTGS